MYSSMDAEIKPQHIHISAQAEVAGERGLVGLHLEIDAGHDVHTAAGHPEVNGNGRTELETGF